MTLDQWKTLSEVILNFVTSLGILTAGLWTYFTFVRGRTFAANIEIEFAPKQIVELSGTKAVIITVKVKNIGRTRVKKRQCHIVIDWLTDDRSLHQVRELSRIDGVLDFPSARRSYDIFQSCIYLEPAETAIEDVLIALGDVTVFKAGVQFVGYESKLLRLLAGNKDEGWTSSATLDVQALNMNKSQMTEAREGGAR